MKNKDAIFREFAARSTINQLTGLPALRIHICAREWLQSYLQKYPEREYAAVRLP